MFGGNAPRTNLRAGQFLPQPDGYRAFIPASLPPGPTIRMDEELLRLLSDADRCLGRLDGVASFIEKPQVPRGSGLTTNSAMIQLTDSLSQSYCRVERLLLYYLSFPTA